MSILHNKWRGIFAKSTNLLHIRHRAAAVGRGYHWLDGRGAAAVRAAGERAQKKQHRLIKGGAAKK